MNNLIVSSEKPRNLQLKPDLQYWITILELKSNTASILNIINVFSITTNDKPNQWLGYLNLLTITK